MRNGIETRPNGATIATREFPCGFKSYWVVGSRNGPWDYLHNARADANAMVLDEQGRRRNPQPKRPVGQRHA